MIRHGIIIIFFAASVLLLVYFINPTFAEVQAIRAQTAKLDKALNDSRQIQNLRNSLVTRFNTIPSADLDKIKKVVPDHVDNVRLILEINRIAREHGLSIQDVRVGTVDSAKQSLGPDESVYGTTNLDVTIAGSYRSFVDFLRDLERGVRVVDIRTLSFTSAATDFNRYNLGLTTYWLR